MPYLRAGLMPHEPGKGTSIVFRRSPLGNADFELKRVAYEFMKWDDKTTQAELKRLGLCE